MLHLIVEVLIKNHMLGANPEDILKIKLKQAYLPDCLQQESHFQELFVISLYQNLSRQQS